MRSRGVALLLTAALLASPLTGIAGTVAGEPAIGGLSVTSNVTFRQASFVLTGDIAVHSGGRLVLDNTTVLVRMGADLDVGIRVEAGGELVIVNHSRITSTFVSVGYSVHYMVYVEPGAHFVFQDSTIDSAYAIGVGDESAVIENVTISNTYIGLYGYNLTVNGARFLGDTLGFWVDGHSYLRDVVAQSNLVYGGFLAGTSRLEGGSFSDNTVADLATRDNASVANTTHRRASRGIVVNGNITLDNVTVRGAVYGAVQLGDLDFRYGCGIFTNPIPQADWLNLHLFPYYYRVNNTLHLTDLDVDGAAAGILYAKQVWRRGQTVASENNPTGSGIDDCFRDPPAPVPAEPLFNTVEWTVTRPTSVFSLHNDFNGTVRVLPGGSLSIVRGDWMFISAGEDHRVESSGSLFSLDEVNVRTALANYSSDLLEFGLQSAPGVDVDVQAGSVSVRDSLLQGLGTDPDRGAASGLVVGPGAEAVEVVGTVINQSTRGIVVGCCTPGGGANVSIALDRDTFQGQGALLELWGANAEVLNSTLGNASSQSLWAGGGASRVSLYATAGNPGGPGTMTVDRYAAMEARVVWPDQRPVAGATFVATDTVTAQEAVNATTDGAGWIPFSFVRFTTSAWDGSTQSSSSPHPFMLTATYGNISAVRSPVDVSVPAVHTLILPDARSPSLSVSADPVVYTNLNYGTVNGTAQDFETGISLVEVATDAGGFVRVTPPGPPLEGEVNFSTSYTGLAPGIHVVTFRAWDMVGNSGEAASVIIVDPLPPSISPDQPLNFTTNVRDFNVTGRMSEPGTVTIGNFTAVVTEESPQYSIPYHLATDSEVLRILASDLAGNVSPWSMVVRLDQTPPELTLSSPANGSYVTTPNVLLRGTMEPTATIYLNGVRLSIGGQTSFSIPAFLTEGENALELRAVDAAGNDAVIPFTVHLDTGVPPLDIISPDASATLSSKDFAIVLRTEAGAMVRVENTTVVAEGPIVTVPFSLADGRYSLGIEVTDAAGNTARRVLLVSIDTRTPLLSVSGGDNQLTEDETYRVLVQTEPDAYVRIGQWEGQASSDGVAALNVRLHPGDNTVSIDAWDAAGNTAHHSIRVTLQQPDPAAPAGLAFPTGGSIVLFAIGAAVLAVAAPIARRIARILP